MKATPLSCLALVASAAAAAPSLGAVTLIERADQVTAFAGGIVAPGGPVENTTTNRSLTGGFLPTQSASVPGVAETTAFLSTDVTAGRLGFVAELNEFAFGLDLDDIGGASNGSFDHGVTFEIDTPATYRLEFDGAPANFDNTMIGSFSFLELRQDFIGGATLIGIDTPFGPAPSPINGVLEGRLIPGRYRYNVTMEARLDEITGAVNVPASGQVDWDGTLIFSVNAIPEPGGTTLVGVLALTACWWRC